MILQSNVIVTTNTLYNVMHLYTLYTFVHSNRSYSYTFYNLPNTCCTHADEPPERALPTIRNDQINVRHTSLSRWAPRTRAKEVLYMWRLTCTVIVNISCKHVNNVFISTCDCTCCITYIFMLLCINAFIILVLNLR